MKRAQSVGLKALAIFLLWGYFLSIRDKFPYTLSLIILLAPMILLAVFGVYAASDIAYHTLTLRDNPGAFKELQEQIREARADLSRKGFAFN